MELPLYRAKIKDQEVFVVGYLIKDIFRKYILVYDSSNEEKRFIIDEETLSIHLPGLVDINNNKLFASLSKFGKGGDKLYALENILVDTYENSKRDIILVLKNNTILGLIQIQNELLYFDLNNFQELKKTGIQLSNLEDKEGEDILVIGEN